MYETEIKIEIYNEQLGELLAACKQRGFVDRGVVLQRDYYVKAVESSHGNPRAYDIERYRLENGTFFHTTKMWEVEDGKPVRREEENEVTAQEFEKAVAAAHHAIKISKDRHWFTARSEGREISLSIDSVKFDHSPHVRHFVEPEILVDDKKKVAETKDFLRRFIADLLHVEAAQITEAPGMFALAYKKL